MSTKAVHRALGLVSSLVLGCDIFHSTDWPTLCAREPEATGCGAAASGGAGGSASGGSATGLIGGEASDGGAGAAAGGTAGGGGRPCVPSNEDCTTPDDDDCDGLFNEGCPAVSYRMLQTPDMGSYAYYDEPHNLATTGDPADNSLCADLATGQLLDGAKGGNLVGEDLGQGPAYEWVAWVNEPVDVDFAFAALRTVAGVVIGINNQDGGGVSQPNGVSVSFSLDGVGFDNEVSFSLADGTQPSIPLGQRGDVALSFDPVDARFVRIHFVPGNSWVFVDDVVFP